MGDKQDDTWRQELDQDRYAVLREGQTEPPHAGKLLHNKEAGIYICGACNAELFKSEHKFDSRSGWPSFYDALNSQAINLRPDNSHGMRRTEVTCRQCDSHLGHAFEDAPQTPTNMRYCVNSLALKFKDRRDNITEG